MFNAINKTLALLTVVVTMLCSCTDKDRAGADELLAQSRTAIESRRFYDAITILDTLNARYPKQTEVRRQGLMLRASAMEGLAIDSIAAGDALLAAATMEVEELQPQFKHVEGPAGLEGYWLPAKAPEKIMGTTTVQGRVSDDGYFYIVANVQGRAIGLNAIAISSGSETVESSPISAARVVKVEGSETASFSPEDVEALGAWLDAHPGANKLVLKGAKGKADVKLTPALRDELVLSYKYARVLQARRLAAIHREKYERMLAAARDQLANFTPVAEQ